MTLYLDTETTGFSPASGARLVEIAIVDDKGGTVIDSLIDPGISIPPDASRVHGITNAMVRGQPRLDLILPRLRSIFASAKEAVIYNSEFDMPFFPPDIWNGVTVHCAMRTFAQIQGTRWQKLDVAAAHVGHVWTGSKHRALADALAARSVWHWCTRKR